MLRFHDTIPYDLFHNYSITGLTVVLNDCKAFVRLKEPRNISSAMIVAAYIGNEDCFNMLMKCGCDPKYKDYDGVSAPYVAAQKGHVGFLRLLKKPALIYNKQISMVIHRSYCC